MKKIALMFLFFTLTSIGIVYYYWQQATNLPKWYQSNTPNNQILDLRNPEQISQAKNRIDKKIEDTLISQENLNNSQPKQPTDTTNNQPNINPENPTPQNIEIKLNSQEFNDLVVAEIAQKNLNPLIIQTTKGVKTSIKNGTLEAGTVINLASIKPEQLPTEQKAQLDQIIQTFPFLTQREIYIALEGKPTLENGKLNFDDNTRIKIGNLSLTLAEISQKIGISKQELQTGINLDLQLGNYQINDIKIKDDKAILQGSVTSTEWKKQTTPR